MIRLLIYVVFTMGFAAGFPSSSLAVLLYDVDFNADAVGAPPALGFGPIPRSTPTKQNVFPRTSSATVVSSFGALSNQPLEIQASFEPLPSTTSRLTGRTFEFSLDDGDIPKFNFYRAQADVIVDTITQNRVALFIDAPSIHSIAFRPGGNIETAARGGTSVIGTWTSGQLFTTSIDFDLFNGKWSAGLNGETLFSAATSDTMVRQFRFGTTTNGQSLSYFDNIRVEGSVIPEPSTFLLFGSGLAGVVAWRWRKAKGSKS